SCVGSVVLLAPARPPSTSEAPVPKGTRKSVRPAPDALDSEMRPRRLPIVGLFLAGPIGFDLPLDGVGGPVAGVRGDDLLAVPLADHVEPDPIAVHQHVCDRRFAPGPEAGDAFNLALLGRQLELGPDQASIGHGKIPTPGAFERKGGGVRG